MAMLFDANGFIPDNKCKTCGETGMAQGECQNCGENNWKKREKYNMPLGGELVHKELDRKVIVREVVEDHDRARECTPQDESAKAGYVVDIPAEDNKGYIPYKKLNEFQVA